MIKFEIEIKRKRDAWKFPFSEKNLTSLSCEMFERNDISLPSYGIISNKGKLSFVFNDKDRDFKYYFDNYILSNKFEAEIYIENTMYSAKSQKIAHFLCTDWDYDQYDKTVTISLQDDLLEWQELTGETIDFKQNRTAFEMYESLVSFTDNFEFEIDEKTEEYLKSTTFSLSFVKKNNLWNMWQSFCEALALHLYKNPNGKVKISKSY